ncbi:MAG: DMT family transporter [Clostridia bacterium]|nr:DMT family transporter [Clostridia bacterium]
MNTKINKFKKSLLAFSCAFAWAFAFPLIKLGISQFDIQPTDAAAKILFAGIRFFAAGVFVWAISLFSQKQKCIDSMKTALLILFFGLINISLHYAFYYIGLSRLSGSRSAVIDSLSTFILIILSCIIFADEHFTVKKAVGCILGISGIITVNLGSGSDTAFSFGGDGMLILSAVFSAFGGILTRVVSKKTDILKATGISLLFGGAGLMICGIIFGGRLNTITPFGIFILCCLTLISVYGFSVYNYLLSKYSVGEIAIFNSLIPIMGVLLSCIILKEPFKAQYIIAGILVSLGVYVINSQTEIKRKGK